MTPQEYYDRLEQMDWYYAMSDDGSVYRRGREAEAALESAARTDSVLAALLQAYKNHMFSGPSWGTQKAPKPQRPTTQGSTDMKVADFRLKTVAELVQLQNDMVLTAIDLGVTPTPEAATTFPNTDQGIAACMVLDTAIQKKRAAAGGKDPATVTAASPAVGKGKKQIPADAVAKVDGKPVKPAKGKKDAPPKEGAAPSPMTRTQKRIADGKTKKSKFGGLKKDKVKPTKAAKSAPAEKAAKSAPKMGGRSKFAYQEDATLVLSGSENKRREGSRAHAAYELIRKFAGKTVKAYYAGGGSAKFVESAVRRGFLKAVAPAK